MPVIFYISYATLWVLVLLNSVLLLLIYRHFGLMALGTVEGVQRDGLAVGSAAPQFSAVKPEGETVRWTPTNGDLQLLAFVAPNCAPCAKIIPTIDFVARSNVDVQVTLVVDGPTENLLLVTEKFNPSSEITCLNNVPG